MNILKKSKVGKEKHNSLSSAGQRPANLRSFCKASKEREGNVTFPLKIYVKTNKSLTKLLVDKNSYTMHLKSPPTKNKANQELIKVLSKHFNKKLKIISGLKSKTKIIDLVH